MSGDPRRATRWALPGLLVATSAIGLAAFAPRVGHAVLIGYGTSDQPAQAVYGAVSTAPYPTAKVTKHQFFISGQLGGLFPGATVALVLVVFNPNKAAITVTSITTTVGDGSASCPGTYLQVAALNGPFQVGPNQTSFTTVTATMEHSAPDACQGVVFPLQYSGVGQAS